MIIGITGTLGAGKGTVVEFLKQKGFTHYSVREFLIKEIEKRGLPVNRDSMVFIGNKLRERNSSSIIEQLYQQAVRQGGNAIIESIRAVGEVEALKSKGNFHLIAIDAPPSVRYSRVILRNSETDNVDYSTFLENEKRESQSENPSEQNLKKCIAMADFIIQNNKDLGYLQKQVDLIYEKIKNSDLIKESFTNSNKNERRDEEINSTEKKFPLNKGRLSWDEYFMKMAALVAERSTCLRHNIGAVIVRDRRVLTTGYNGAARGAQDCLELGCRKDELNLPSGFGSEECRAIHAEQNAIIQAALHGINTQGATLYCTTIPCRMCAKEIINAGIKEVITYSLYEGAKGSEEFLEKHGVSMKKVPRPSNIISFKD